MRTVTLYGYRVSVIRTPKHRYAIDIEVEAIDDDAAKDLVLWAYPKGKITQVERMDDPY